MVQAVHGVIEKRLGERLAVVAAFGEIAVVVPVVDQVLDIRRAAAGAGLLIVDQTGQGIETGNDTDAVAKIDVDGLAALIDTHQIPVGRAQ